MVNHAAAQRMKDLNAVHSSHGDSSNSRHVYCSNCYGLACSEHYHCNICSGGDFDLCQGCVEDGVRCGDESHRMIKRYIKNDDIIPSATENLNPIAAPDGPNRKLVDGKSFRQLSLCILLTQFRIS